MTKHDAPKLSARNFFLTIRVYLNGCSVHLTHVVVYPGSGTKIVVSREVDDNHPECRIAPTEGSHGGGDFGPPAPPGTSRYIEPLMKSRATGFGAF